MPIVIAITLWGPHWSGRQVCCLGYNTAVVAAVNKVAAKDPTLSHLLQILALVAAILDVSVVACHLPGAQNASADALSRNRLSYFFFLNPQASPVPAIIPPELWTLVFNRDLRWTFPHWIHLLSCSFVAALHLPPAQPIDLHACRAQWHGGGGALSSPFHNSPLMTPLIKHKA